MSVTNVITTTILLLMTSLCSCDPVPTSVPDYPLEQEMKCLDIQPKFACDAIIIYPAEDLETLECDYLVPAEYSQELKAQPRIEVVDPKGQFPRPVLVVMFDPDIPTTNMAEGFVHWVAKGKLQEGGSIDDIQDLPELDYYPPSPPEGPAHRYQVFVFEVEGNQNIHAYPSPTFLRLDHLCAFIGRNSLAKPIASTQFRYQAP